MLILLTSPSCFGKPLNTDFAEALKDFSTPGHPVAVTSNHIKPQDFDEIFQGSGVQFLQEKARQNGHIIVRNAEHFNMQPFNVLVVAGSKDDIQMGKNGGAIVIGAGWAGDTYTQSLGIRASNVQELREVIRLSASWTGQWWYAGNGLNYNVNALADLSTYGRDRAQTIFADRLKQTVKQGGAELNSLLAITARSLLMDGFGNEDRTLWGVYPSSSSSNDDKEVLSDFCHRLRTTVSRVRFAKVGEPLFIRHTPSIKRSAGGAGDREDPTDQIRSLHLNPFYKGKLVDRHVVVLDDCTTYGVSFAVSAAYLKKAGARQVTCVALGKFGNRLRHQTITIESDPYAPVNKYIAGQRTWFEEERNIDAQYDLTELV